jgi:hypothetical protein
MVGWAEYKKWSAISGGGTFCDAYGCSTAYDLKEVVPGKFLCPVCLAAYPTSESVPTTGVPEMKVFASGAKSTVKKPEYYLIPLIALQLLAERFGYGKARHGERNYRKGANDPEFVTDRIDHLIEHVHNYAEHRKRSDLAAVLCNAAMLADLGAFTDDETKEKK